MPSAARKVDVPFFQPWSWVRLYIVLADNSDIHEVTLAHGQLLKIVPFKISNSLVKEAY